MSRNTCSIDGCDNFCVGRGWCGKHYMRWKRHGDPLATPRFCPPEERFWRYVDKTPNCWIWTGAKAKGYGHFVLSQRPTKTQKAYRYAYELLIGPIPEGLHMHHICENPLCVNPDHLIPMTPKQHSQILVAKRTHCKHGHAFDEANTYIYKAGPKKGHRKCRACEAGRMRAKRAQLTSPRKRRGVGSI